MSRDGNGNYTIPNTFSSGTTISSSDMNSNFSDIATAMTASIAKDGQTTPTANLPMGNYKHTGVGAAASRTDYAQAGEVQGSGYIYATVGGTADVITLTTTFAPSAYAAGNTVRFIAGSNNTGAVTVNWNSLGAKNLYAHTGRQLLAGDLVANRLYEATYDGTQFVVSGAIWERDVLNAARTYYVRTDGNDANTGLANTSGGAFLTIQKALDIAASLDLNGYALTIQVGNGTYAQALSVLRMTGLNYYGQFVLQGDTTTPSNVVVAPTSGDACLYVYKQAQIKVQGFRFGGGSGYSHGIHADNNSVVGFNKIDFAAVPSTHFTLEANSTVIADGDYSISGGTPTHINLLDSSTFYCVSRTVTITGTPNFSSVFCGVSRNANAVVHSNTYSGSATGTRYYASFGATINVNGGGASYLPGDVAGSVDATTYGVYA